MRTRLWKKHTMRNNSSSPSSIKSSSKWIVFGLGNPGSKYEKTRHNVGFMCVDRLARDLNFGALNSFNCNTYYKEGSFENKQICLAQPQTMMNLSGTAVSCLSKQLNVPPKQLIVIYDDLNIPLGTLRIKPTGSAGGQNGVKDVLNKLQKDDFVRIRFGIGPAFTVRDKEEFVLKPFLQEEQTLVNLTIQRVSQAVQAIFSIGLMEAMNRFNKSAEGFVEDEKKRKQIELERKLREEREKLKQYFSKQQQESNEKIEGL